MDEKPWRRQTCGLRVLRGLRKLGWHFLLADNDLPISLRLNLIFVLALGFALVGDLLNIGSWLHMR